MDLDEAPGLPEPAGEGAETEARPDGVEEEPQLPDWDDRDEIDLDDEEPGFETPRRLDAKRSTFHGQVVLGDSQVAGGDIYNLWPPAVHAISGLLRASTVARLRASFVETGTVDRLVTRLGVRRVQVLYGPIGSGRRTTAVIALDRLGVPVEVLDARDSPDALVATKFKTRGYVIEYSERLNEALLASIRDAASRADAYLVVVPGADFELTSSILAEHFVSYEPPPPQDVLWKLLRGSLGKERASTLKARLARDSELQELYERRLSDAGHRLAEVVAFARDLYNLARGTVERDEFVARLRAEQRGLLRNWLVRASTPGTGENQAPTLQDAALLLAAAVLDGYPLHRVMGAANQLADLLHRTEKPGVTPPRPVFRNSFVSCGKWLRVSDPGARDRRDHARYAAEKLPGAAQTRRVWLLSERLPEIVLELVWQDFSALHRPLAAWLGKLVRGQSDYVRRRSARAVGILATCDFEHVDRLILGRWASVAHPYPHDAAARALAIAASDHATAVAARRTVRRWSDPEVSGKERQKTAYLAYAYGVGTPLPSDIQRVLGLMDAFPEAGSEWVPARLGDLVDEGRGGVVLEALAGWDSPDSKLFLRRLAEGDGTDRHAALLTATADAPTTRHALARLMTYAPGGGTSLAGAWPLLRRWVVIAGEQPALRSALFGLVRALWSIDARLRDQLRFQLRLWADQRVPPLPAAPMLLRQLDHRPVGEEDAHDPTRPA